MTPSPAWANANRTAYVAAIVDRHAMHVHGRGNDEPRLDEREREPPFGRAPVCVEDCMGEQRLAGKTRGHGKLLHEELVVAHAHDDGARRAG
jgi:hypothetical protein